MCIDTNITHHTDYEIAVPFPIIDFFSQPNISHIDLVSLFAITHQQIIRLNISVNKAFKINKLNTRNELIREHKHRLKRELPTPVIKKILQI